MLLLSYYFFLILFSIYRHKQKMYKRGAIENGEEEDKKMKRIRVDEEEEAIGFVNLDENLLYEVLKHVDARSLASAACVSKLWHKTAQDERLWELICTKHLANMGCPNQQLRSVVLALGGFRQLLLLLQRLRHRLGLRSRR